MISFKTFLTEIHYTDIYPKDFHQFYNKWKKYKSDDSYWVNFTMNPQTDVLNKNFAQANMRTHSDLSGLYGYPLSYVIHYPADVWYGRGAKYLRVFKIKDSARILHLQNIDNYSLKNTILSKMGLIEYNLKKAKRLYGCTEKQALFNLTQIKNLDVLLAQKTLNRSELEIKTGEEQVQFWKELGYQGLIDEARNQKTAIINDREPWQCVIFDKKAFDIVDIYELNPKSTHLSHGGLGTSEDEQRIKKRLAALICLNIDDSLSKSYTNSKFWTKKGRRIEIDFSFPTSYMDNLTMGEKPHKYSKKYDHHTITVDIYSEKEKYAYTWDSDVQITDIAKEVGEDWKTLNDNPNFIPEYSKEEYEKKENDKRMDQYKKDKIKLIKGYEDKILKLCNIYNVDWKSLTDDEWFKAYVECKYLQTYTNKGKSFNDYFKKEAQAYEDKEKRKEYLLNLKSDQMYQLLYKIYHDKTKILKSGWVYVNGERIWFDKDSPIETTIAEAVKYLQLSSGWFSDKEWLIFSDVLDWKETK